MTAKQLRYIVPLCTVIALICACSKPAADAASSTSGDGFDQLADTVEGASTAANDAEPAANALQPNERVQGTIQFDIGKGAETFRSIATKIPDDLGDTTAERLGSAAGQKDLADAQSRVGGSVEVRSSDVQNLADAVAGKTMYTSEMYSVAMINQRGVDLSGVAADGRIVSLNILFPMDSDTPTRAKLEYIPNGKKRMQSLETERKAEDAVQVTLERFERVDDNTMSIAGSFKASTLKPGVLAKDLAGQEITGASGRFDFTEVHVRPEM